MFAKLNSHLVINLVQLFAATIFSPLLPFLQFIFTPGYFKLGFPRHLDFTIYRQIFYSSESSAVLAPLC